jgi:nucleotide-binding universal stress UspA family protein
MIELKNVLVATDFGDASDAALVYGRTLARAFGATLYVLHVVDDVFACGLEAESIRMWPEQQHDLEEEALKSLQERVTPDDGRRFSERAVMRISSRPAEAIVAFAKETGSDLIVMGTQGRGVVDRLGIGSVAARVVHAAPCPVLTVKHPEHEFVRSASASTAVSG